VRLLVGSFACGAMTCDYGRLEMLTVSGNEFRGHEPSVVLDTGQAGPNSMAAAMVDMAANLGSLASLLMIVGLFCLWFKTKKKPHQLPSPEPSPQPSPTPLPGMGKQPPQLDAFPQAEQQVLAAWSNRQVASAMVANGQNGHILGQNVNGQNEHIPGHLESVKEETTPDHSAMSPPSPLSTEMNARMADAVEEGSLATQMAVVVLTIDEDFDKVCGSEIDSKVFGDSSLPPPASCGPSSGTGHAVTLCPGPEPQGHDAARFTHRSLHSKQTCPFMI
jgi:hypothetical protein